MFAGNTNVVPVIAPLNEYAFTFSFLDLPSNLPRAPDLQGLMVKQSLMSSDSTGLIPTGTFVSHLGHRRNQTPLFSFMMLSNHSPFGLVS